MRTYDISSKEAYLAWVAEWKEQYKTLTQEIRELKKILAQPHIVTEYTNTYNGWVWKNYTSNVSGEQSKKVALRRRAESLLILRHAARSAAGRAKQERLKSTV